VTPPPVAQWLSNAGVGSVAELLLVLLIASLLAAVMLAPVAEKLYGRLMLRYMGMTEVADAPPAWWQRRARALQRRTAAAADDLPLREAAALRERRLRHATGAAALAFVGGSFLLWPLQASLSDQLAASAIAALLMLGPAIVNVRPHMPGRWLWAVPAGVVIAGFGVEALETGGTLDLGDAAATLLVFYGLLAISVHRTLRAVVGPMMLLGVGLLVGMVAAAQVQWPGAVCDDTRCNLRGVLQLCAWIALLAAGLWLAVGVLQGLVRLIDRGWVSDVSLVAAFGMVCTAALVVLVTSDDRAGFGGPALAGLAWAASPLAAYVAVLRRTAPPCTARSLLVLRVFSRDARAERMLDALQTRWRFAGPVLQIGGPDLATLNLDLYEFVKLVTFRLHDLVQPRGLPDDAFAASLDLAADREGRFRVNEVYCFDSSWKTMVERLMAMSDAIVLDLRGFTVQRGGTTHEVLRLAALGVLDRVVAVTDAQTDWRHFQATVDAVQPGARPAARVEATAPKALDDCLSALYAAAGRTPRRG
jgi:hypothetical protein